MTKEEWKEYCKLNNLCTVCHKPLDRQGAICSSCLKKKSDRSKADREWYLSHHICPICHKNTIGKNERSCPECRAKETARRRALGYKDRYAYTKGRRERLKSMGLCYICGKNPVEGETLSCAECRTNRKKRYKELHPDIRSDRIKQRRCYICGKTPVVVGKALCEDCYKRQCDNLKKAHEARKKQLRSERNYI